MNSIRCSVWPEGRRQCSAPAYETLRELCMDHYRELVIRPTWLAYCQIEDEWNKIQHDLYEVEVALGLRPGRDAMRLLAKLERPTKREHRQRNEQLIDDEEVNNEI